MKIGRVIGSVWATKKDEKLNGQKLLIIKILEDEKLEQSGFIVAADIVGAGVGDMVLLVNGSAARYAIGNHQTPVDTAIVGIVDTIEVNHNE